jgi:hypothetical protein
MKILKSVHDSISKFVGISQKQDIDKSGNNKSIDNAFKRAAFKLKPEKLDEILSYIDYEKTTINSTDGKLKEVAKVLFHKMDLLVKLEEKIQDVRHFAENTMIDVWKRKRSQKSKYDLGNLTTAFEGYLDTIKTKTAKGKTMKEIWAEEFGDDDMDDEEEDDLDVEEMAKLFMQQASMNEQD